MECKPSFVWRTFWVAAALYVLAEGAFVLCVCTVYATPGVLFGALGLAPLATAHTSPGAP